MKKIYCSIHNLNIDIYLREEEYLFIDDNGQESIIFYDGNNNKYLKRFTTNYCDENCGTIKQMLKEKSNE